MSQSTLPRELKTLNALATLHFVAAGLIALIGFCMAASWGIPVFMGLMEPGAAEISLGTLSILALSILGIPMGIWVFSWLVLRIGRKIKRRQSLSFCEKMSSLECLLCLSGAVFAGLCFKALVLEVDPHPLFPFPAALACAECLACLAFPLGTVIGAATHLLLKRPVVKELFGAQSRLGG